MSKIYGQHEAAFSNVSAFVILGHTNEVGDAARVATIAFKFPKDGAGRLYAYVHYFGVQMQRGFAAGGGYDKKSAAVTNAVEKITGCDSQDWTKERLTEYRAFYAALIKDDGAHWDGRLRDAGFTVLQAV